MNFIKLSKQMSYVLRHHPEALGLQMDPEGFVDVEELAEAINSTEKFERPITAKDFERVIAQGEMQRYEKKLTLPVSRFIPAMTRYG